MKKNKVFKILLLFVFIFILTGCESSEKINYTASNCIKCGETFFPENVAVLSANIINFIKILVPILIIILGMVELLRGMLQGDERKMDDAKASLIRKFVIGITIFLVISIVQFVFSLYGDVSDDKVDTLECLKYFIVKDAAENVGEKCEDRSSKLHTQSGTDQKYDIKVNNDDDDYSGSTSGTTQEERQKQREAEKITNQPDCKAEDGNKWGYYENRYQCYYARDSYINECASKSTADCTKWNDYCEVVVDHNHVPKCKFKY